MTERTSIPPAAWRALSAEISPAIVAGFDVEGIAGLSKAQHRLIMLPKAFAVHKLQHTLRLVTTASALALYGEFDRAVAGLLPLQAVLIEEYLVPDYDYLLSPVRGTRYLLELAGKDELADQLATLSAAHGLYDPLPLSMTSKVLNQDLERTPAELEKLQHLKPSDWVERWVRSVSSYGRAYLYGGSEEYPPARLEKDIARYAEAIFATPGYEPFSDNAYPYK